MKILFFLLSFYSFSLLANPGDANDLAGAAAAASAPIPALAQPNRAAPAREYAALLCDAESQKGLAAMVRDALRFSDWRATLRYEAEEQEQAASPLTQFRFSTGVLNFSVGEEPCDGFQNFHISLKEPCLDPDYSDFLRLSRTKGIMFIPVSISLFGAFIALHVAVDATQMSVAEQELCAKVLVATPHVSLIKMTGDVSSSSDIALSQEEQIEKITRSLTSRVETIVRNELENLKNDLASLLKKDLASLLNVAENVAEGTFQFLQLKTLEREYKRLSNVAQQAAVQTRVDAFFDKIKKHVENLSQTIPPEMRDQDSMEALVEACLNYAAFCQNIKINAIDTDGNKWYKERKKTLIQEIRWPIDQMSTPHESLVSVRKSYIPSSSTWSKIIHTLNGMMASSPFSIVCRDLARTTAALLP